jgi:hypothetical protein
METGRGFVARNYGDSERTRRDNPGSPPELSLPEPGLYVLVDIGKIKAMNGRRSVVMFRQDPPEHTTRRALKLPLLGRNVETNEIVEGPDGFIITKSKEFGIIGAAPRVVPLEQASYSTAPNAPEPGRKLGWGSKWQILCHSFPGKVASSPSTTHWTMMSIPGRNGMPGISAIGNLPVDAPRFNLVKKDEAELQIALFELAVGQMKDLDAFFLLCTMAVGNANLFAKLRLRVLKAMRDIEPTLMATGIFHDVVFLRLQRGEILESMLRFEDAVLEYYDAFQLLTEHENEVPYEMRGMALNFLGIALKRCDLFDAAETCYRHGLIDKESPAAIRNQFADLLQSLSDNRGNNAQKRRENNLAGLATENLPLKQVVTHCYACMWPVGAERDAQPREMKRCGGCKRVQFCSEVCQESSWSDHKMDCKTWKAEKAKSDAK